MSCAAQDTDWTGWAAAWAGWAAAGTAGWAVVRHCNPPGVQMGAALAADPGTQYAPAAGGEPAFCILHFIII